VFVSGELTLREYQANDGSTKTSLELNANILDLVGPRNAEGRQSEPQSQRGAKPNQSSSAQQDAGYDNFDAPYDDDIPF
jgi:single-strand DNA-binding protein